MRPSRTAEDRAEFIRQLDTRESAAQELAGEKLLLEARQRFELAVGRFSNLPEPDAASRLSAVDKLTAYDPLSFRIQALLNITVDNLRTLFEFVEKVGAVPMVAHYSLIRSAIEASSLGIWLLAAGRIDKQAFYALRLSYGDHDMLLKLGRSFEQEAMDKPDTVPARLRELQSALGHGYASKNLADGATIVSVLENADRVMKSNRYFFTGEQAWRAASGAAHGNTAVLQNILERVPTESVREMSATVILRSRLTFTAGMVLTAIENMEKLTTLYEQAAVPDTSLRDRFTRRSGY